MREYLERVLELVRPYRFRFILGLACGFLSGVLAFTLPVSISLAVDTIFPDQKAIRKASVTTTNASPIAVGTSTNLASSATAPIPPETNQSLGSTAKLKQSLSNALSWFRPSGPPSKARKLL